MSKRLIIILALAFVVGLSVAAYAEVQNVKVSGDINVAGVSRNNLDLAKAPSAGVQIQDVNNDWVDKRSDMLSIARVRIDADLTDNVTTTVRLLNERNWNGESRVVGRNNDNIGFGRTSGVANTATSEQAVVLDLAYVNLKEFLYSPLSLRIGRQELRFGNGLVIGDPDTNLWSSATSLSEGDLSARKSFDAIRLTLDYNPLVIDGVYAVVEKGRNNISQEVSLMGLNAAYDLRKDTTLEAFFFSKTKGKDSPAVMNLDTANATSFVNTTAVASTNKQSRDRVHTVGARVVNKTVKDLTLDAQAAFQFGTYNPKFDTNARWIAAAEKANTSRRRAWALQVEATYDLKETPFISTYISKYSPSITGNYTYLSGASRDKTGNKAYGGWDPMFKDQTYGHLMNAIIANTNMQRGTLSGKAKLTDDVGLKLDYTMAWFAKRYPEGRLAVLSGVANAAGTARSFRMGKEKYIGQEIDATITYDYTEDVQFALLAGIFQPAESINTGYQVDTAADGGRWPKRTAATEVIGSMKVTF